MRGTIPGGKPVLFEPNGPGSLPRIEILRMDWYQPGKKILDHYRVETLDRDGDEARVEEFDTWGAVERTMASRYGDAFQKRFPGAEKFVLRDPKVGDPAD